MIFRRAPKVVGTSVVEGDDSTLLFSALIQKYHADFIKDMAAHLVLLDGSATCKLAMEITTVDGDKFSIPMTFNGQESVYLNKSTILRLELPKTIKDKLGLELK